MSSRAGTSGGSSVIVRGRLKERARDFGRSVKTTSAIIFGLVDLGILAREDGGVLAFGVLPSFTDDTGSLKSA